MAFYFLIKTQYLKSCCFSHFHVIFPKRQSILLVTSSSPKPQKIKQTCPTQLVPPLRHSQPMATTLPTSPPPPPPPTTTTTTPQLLPLPPPAQPTSTHSVLVNLGIRISSKMRGSQIRIQRMREERLRCSRLTIENTLIYTPLPRWSSPMWKEIRKIGFLAFLPSLIGVSMSNPLRSSSLRIEKYRTKSFAYLKVFYSHTFERDGDLTMSQLGLLQVTKQGFLAF